MVNEYEVEVVLTKRSSGERKTITTTEYAYTISDVPAQAIYSVLSDKNPEEWELKIARIGPPRRLVELAAKQVQLTVEKILSQLTEASKQR
jgi:hypothetical protein